MTTTGWTIKDMCMDFSLLNHKKIVGKHQINIFRMVNSKFNYRRTVYNYFFLFDITYFVSNSTVKSKEFPIVYQNVNKTDSRTI